MAACICNSEGSAVFLLSVSPLFAETRSRYVTLGAGMPRHARLRPVRHCCLAFVKPHKPLVVLNIPVQN